MVLGTGFDSCFQNRGDRPSTQLGDPALSRVALAVSVQDSEDHRVARLNSCECSYPVMAIVSR